MGTNNHPSFYKPFITVEGRPKEHEAVIRRQGQSVRFLLAKKCPCIKHGKVNLRCSLCNGKGYILDHQKEMEVIDEDSKNTCSSGPNKIQTYWTPIISVSKVQKYVDYGPRNSGINSVFYEEKK